MSKGAGKDKCISDLVYSPSNSIFKNKKTAWVKWKKYQNILDNEQFSVVYKIFKLLSLKCINKYLYSIHNG